MDNGTYRKEPFDESKFLEHVNKLKELIKNKSNTFVMNSNTYSLLEKLMIKENMGDIKSFKTQVSKMVSDGQIYAVDEAKLEPKLEIKVTEEEPEEIDNGSL